MAYHHGNARDALLQAGAALLESEGASGLSLRRLAEHAGLSRQAPYNHFADKEALLAELVRDGFDRLGSALADKGRSTARLDLLESAAAAYIGFGQDHPARFRLMFGKELVDTARHPAAAAAAAAALARLSDTIAEACPDIAGRIALPDLTLVAWSLVHGYTSLCIETDLEPAAERSDRARLFARTVMALAGPPQP